MDHESLRTASTYLNNLLLARGLLRNGEPIDFVKPSRDSRAQIINLVHDLVLREDRDKEQQEGSAFTIRGLKAEESRKDHEIERLNAKSVESDRAAAQAQAAERTAQVELKKVEKAMKSLQDQTTKLKTTLAQVKTQCNNDVRKRDLELQRLKTHLQGQQRGSRVGMSGPSMTVRKSATEGSTHDIGDPEYSLKQETTEFLTQLSQSLSDENDSLIALIRNALSTLKDLLGLSVNARKLPDSAMGSMGSMGSEGDVSGKKKGGSEMLHTLPNSLETLSADMAPTLEHLKTILTNPNFVSMEEVEMREEEIARLRAGWEHMEKRWRDVMYMLQGWLRRMSTGETINIEDVRHGIGLVSPNRTREEQAQDSVDVSLLSSDPSEIRLPGIPEELGNAIFSPIRRSGRGNDSPKRKRDVLEPPEFFDLRPSCTASGPTPPSPPKHSSPRGLALTSSAGRPVPPLLDDEDSEELEVPQMTIAEKLSAAQEEAEQATAAAAARAADDQASAVWRSAKMPAYALNGSGDDGANEKDDDTLGTMQSPMGKRTKIRGRARKRKSTLSPEELQSLICADE